MIEKLGQRVGVDLSAHSLRRLFAMTMLDLGIDLEEIRVMMRHKFVETTLECYIEADPRRASHVIECIDLAL